MDFNQGTVQSLIQGGEAQTWTRHPTLYLADGSAVLRCNKTLFRFYACSLEKNLDVFRDMLALGEHQPVDAEMYDGCPLVFLSDSLDDVECLLLALLQFNYVPDFQNAMPFKAAVTLLRLSSKYAMDVLRTSMVERFSALYPHDFTAFHSIMMPLKSRCTAKN
ncbi:hypothetical protein M422DRAFT_37953 [Sphaerobolus stellatus SS14]|uniref:BTB domain-containing protein n=1 Tax=Sphaerobolus stellatus (strain SS14) TaxID=990650 RepID=A0A0C9TD24_SPHS4|nr:hypothetical protein M422DRAFT_37953 [Sphaerobolus stellatus SS14]